MKRILLFFAMIAMVMSAFALQPQRGYRGFVDWDNNLYRETSFEGSDKHVSNYWYSGISTSHGYQFHPNFYLGAGVSLLWYNEPYANIKWMLPVFIDVRTDQKFGWFTPFGSMRIGWSMTDGGGLYLQPMIGYRFNWGRKVGINLGVGLTVKGRKLDIYDFKITPEGYMAGEFLGKISQTDLMFAFRVGIDF